MTEETIKKLPDILKKHVCTLKKASLDDSKSSYMCESTVKVIDFDKIPNEYSRGKGFPSVPNSNDALYISVEGKWYFIEFKNGSIDKANIYRKLYDSLIMLLDEGIIPSLDFVRENIEYILVYNSNKYPKVPKSEGRNENYSYFIKLAGTEEKLFGIENFEKYLLKEAHTYTKEQFTDNFINPIEKQESLEGIK